MPISSLLAVCVLAFVFFFAFPSYSHAYLDPGTGSYIFQLLIAGLLGLLFLLKVYWNRVKGFVVSLFSGSKEAAEAEERQSDRG